MGAERQKGKIFNFSFLALSGLRDEVPNVLRFLNEIEKRLKRAIKFLWKCRRQSQNGFNKIAEIRRNYFVIVL